MFMFLVFVFLPITLVASHSWIACTDYDEFNGMYYEQSKCHGWARSGHQYTPKSQPFGYESGYAYVPQVNRPCKTMRNDACGYNSEHPMASYYLGQTVVISHPTKNHCNDPRCGDTHNQDNGNFVYAVATTKSGTSDPPLDSFIDKSNLIADLGISPVAGRPGYQNADFTTYPKPGFQNAPAYCSGRGTDSALATNKFKISKSLKPGRYTFMWVWYMGSKLITSAYSSCWEADIYSTKQEALDAREEATKPAYQDVAVTFDHDWGNGADGHIAMPADFNTSYVLVKFPNAIGTFSVYGALMNTTTAQMQRGEYTLYQQGDGDQLDSAGFTVSFNSETVAMPCSISPQQIETRVVKYGDPIRSHDHGNHDEEHAGSTRS